VSSSRTVPEDDYLGEFHVYAPHKAGLPPLGQYFRELWRRREFAVEMSRAQIRAANANKVLGVLWNILNPILLAAVYYVLVVILTGGESRRAEYFAYIVAGLFAFYFLSGCMNGGASSITGAGRIIMNTAFPRMLLVISAVSIALRRFLPTMGVYVVIALATGTGIPPTAVLAIPMFLLLLVFGMGMGLLLATAQVYFRDTTSFLPYLTRIWLYTSPVLYPIAFYDRLPESLQGLVELNPLYSLIGGWNELLVHGVLIPAEMWIAAVLWSFGVLLVGAVVFMSRERDFAVRL
jgi:teichoic acid transport system permease protein